MQATRLEQALWFANRPVVIYLLLVVGGCQQRLTTASGTVTLDGRPLAVPSDARGTVVFQPDGGRGTMAVGLLDSAGHFDLATGSSKEVAPGRYYVTVSVVQLLPNSGETEQGTQIITPAKYASASESGLQADVMPGTNQFSFDLVSSADNERVNSPSASTDITHSNSTQP
jgi:hypothetical protein